jgi:hypothetical protein
MQTAIFYGASDDLIEIDGVKGGDEFGAWFNSEELMQGCFVLGGVMKIYAIYDGCWHFSIGPVDEDIEMPDWPIRYKLHERGYSVQLEIDVPDNVAVFKLSK